MKIDRENAEKSTGKWFEWTIFEITPVDQSFFTFFQKNLSNLSNEQLNKDFFKLENQSIHKHASFDNEKEALEYAIEKSLENKSLYIIKCCYADMSLMTGKAYYTYHFVGWAYKGDADICEREEFKKLREQQNAIDKCKKDSAIWLVEEGDKLYATIKDGKARNKKLEELLAKKEEKEQSCIKKITKS